MRNYHFLSRLGKHWILFIFLLFYLSYALAFYKSFGITWDEQTAYERGKVLYEHLFDQNFSSNNLLIKTAPNDLNPDYYSAYPAVLYALNQEESYNNYHLLNLLFGTSIFIFAYFLIYKKYKSPLLSIIAPTILVLTPRFFGDLPANPKDMPFAIMYFLSLTTIYLTKRNKNILAKTLLLSVIFGFSQGIRILGFTLYPLLFIFDCYVWQNDQPKKKTDFIDFLKQELVFIAMIFLASNFILLVTWPYLGSNYFKNLIDVLQISKKFPWNGYILFMGKAIKSTQVPRIYIPVWLLITTPIFILVSVISSFFLFIKGRLRNDLLFLIFSAILINLGFYFIFKPIVYNGPRQFLFISPLFAVTASVFIIELLKSKKTAIKNIVISIFILNALFVVYNEVKLFPYQYIYFNLTVGGVGNAYKNFETDYWVASSKEALFWLEKNTNQNKKYAVSTCGLPPTLIYYYPPNFYWVPDIKSANYAICPINSRDFTRSGGKIIHIVTRESAPLSFVVQIKK